MKGRDELGESGNVAHGDFHRLRWQAEEMTNRTAEPIEVNLGQLETTYLANSLVRERRLEVVEHACEEGCGEVNLSAPAFLPYRSRCRVCPAPKIHFGNAGNLADRVIGSQLLPW